MRAHVHIHVELPPHCMLLRGEDAEVLHEREHRKYMWMLLWIVFSCVENEPRDAGTDQRSSGIIRLHTIKQIIDRVRSHTYKGTKCNAWTHSLWIALLPPAGELWYSMLYSRTFESPWNQEEASLYVFCRINMQCWILLLTQWIGWTMLSGIPSWCSWILTVSRVWRTWGPDCVLSPGRVPGNSMSVHLNWERTTTTYSQVNTDVLRLCFLYCKKKMEKRLRKTVRIGSHAKADNCSQSTMVLI